MTHGQLTDSLKTDRLSSTDSCFHVFEVFLAFAGGFHASVRVFSSTLQLPFAIMQLRVHVLRTDVYTKRARQVFFAIPGKQDNSRQLWAWGPSCRPKGTTSIYVLSIRYLAIRIPWCLYLRVCSNGMKQQCFMGSTLAIPDSQSTVSISTGSYPYLCLHISVWPR
ncbi:hypothetical protein BDP81DRAFT_16919 [Colletotrichum phormii]|uniref:Uncharacterized protein n=1 Tax=Colletotrichum phormii TaxID=359342 RepID=A0AAJ0EK97_9PEZI|nr:uncharacterized protein BDP81DRAFT_16919 [Colletotrichum phormii]KAK1656190.1 hypothetical protein BDP81DRAFT_16919 [Colletotrichum phormii]